MKPLRAPAVGLAQSEAGFSLLDTLLVLGVGLTVLGVVLENGSQTRSQLAKLSEKLRPGDVESQVFTVFAGSNIGSQALRNFSGSSRPQSWEETFPPVEVVKLVPESGNALNCPSDGISASLTSAQKIPVDALYLGGPYAVKGLPLKWDPRIKLDDLYLSQVGIDGQCPSRSECRQKPCRFRLRIQLSSSLPDAVSSPLKEISVPLHCSTRELSSGSNIDVLDQCSLREVQIPSPTPTATSCVGDLNQDGVTDFFDLKMLERVWGAVPTLGAPPDLIARFQSQVGPMEWVAAGSSGSFPSPSPVPGYTSAEFSAFRLLHRKADIAPVALGGDGLVNGEDLGLLLGDWGCRITPTAEKPCFKDTPLYHLFLRAARAAEPLTVLDAADRAEIEYCAGAANIPTDKLRKCAGLNLDFKCDQTSSSGNPQGSYCRKVVNGTPESTPAPGFRVVGRGDLEMLDFILMMAATIPRFNQDSSCNASGWDPRKPPKYPGGWKAPKKPSINFYEVGAENI